jgi:glycosyltransferase involved in cell wall biosynthesis
MNTPVSVLLTVPHLNRTSSPYRETMAIAARLPACGFRLTICALREIGFRETAPLLMDLGIHAFVAPFRPTGRSLRHWMESLAAQSAIARSGPFAIQHSLDFTSSPYEALAAAKRSRIFIYSQRNLNEGGHEFALRLKARIARRVVCISRATEDLLRRLRVPAAKLRRVPLGMELPRPAPAATRDRGRFLFVGQIQRRKRHGDAIRALALIARGYPHARLSIAGNVFDAAYLDELKRLAAELGVASRVEFLGTRTDVPDLMRRAEALLLCSESEAFGWVILEAMAHGAPVIASSVDGPSEIIEHGRTGLLVDCSDVAGYAAAMRSLLASPSVGASLAENARRAVAERYSAAAMVNGIHAVYREVLNQR